MDNSDRTFSDLVALLKSWIPWRSEPTQLSRDFWMPDQSCRVCYECDSQFTWFHRRHHCRLCGRIFCNKCTSNWVPAELNESKVVLEEYDNKIRACNYCFKQWKKGLTVSIDEGLIDTNLNISNNSPASASTSFISTKSSGTCDSHSVTFVSFPPSTAISPPQSPKMETSVERRGFVAASSKDHAADIGEQALSHDQFGYFTSRSDDDEDDDGMSHLGSTTSHISQVNGYCEHVQFGGINSEQSSRKVHPDGDAVDSQSLSSSSVQNSLDSQASEDVHHILEKGVEHDIIDECEAPSSMYVAEDVDSEPVDFEKNGVLWLPPEPEDEEDEREAFLLDDDDEEGDTSGDWGYLRNSNSSGSGEFRNREKSNEEHKTAIKNVVNGHFRTLIAQLLQVENLLSGEENEKESWLEIITALSWEAATLLKPDMSKGGQMDPGNYVKIKCLASGCRTESMVVRGIVCKKNVAHRRMTSKMEKARLLILGGALEYQRITNALSSFDTLLQQEMDHLKMAIAKIDAHNPDILLVEKSVSRYAQEYLLAKNISLVLNIKRSLLERIARCTGGQIVSSVDHLSSPTLGYCDMFHVERFLEEHGTAGQSGKKLMKTLMYFEGCPKPLGCTILLRGANGDELKKVKHVLQYGVFAAYHLALETSFLADEGASLPELPLQSPITVALPDKPSTIDRSISTVPGFTVPFTEPSHGPLGQPLRSYSVPIPSVINVEAASVTGVAYAEPSNSSAPIRSSVAKPFIVPSSLDGPTPDLAPEERGLVDWTADSQAKTTDVDTVSPKGNFAISGDLIDSRVKNNQSDFCDVNVSRNVSRQSSLQVDEKQIIEDEPALKEEFPPSPSDHQSILVSLSSRCVWKGTVCERSHLFRIKYYGNFDKPLGRFLRDHLFDQNYVCHSCEMPTEAHVQCYTHRQGTLTISVKKLPEILLPGEKDGKIWMWHRCLKCPRANGFPPATRRVVMSDAAWGLSFGKFLELSFSNHAAASRVASCGHSLHRDCLRFYGFGKMVACFRYASIDVHSVYLPPSKLNFNYTTQEWIEREFNEVVGRAELLFSEVLNALRVLAEKISGLNLLNGALNIESRRQLADLEDVLQKEKAEFEESLQKILNKEAKEGQPVIDILELNRLRRQLIFQSYMWDNRLIYAANLYTTNQPNIEKVTCSDQVENPVLETQNILLMNVPVQTTTTEVLCNADTNTSEANPDQNLEKGLNDGHNDHLKAVHQGTDELVSSSNGADIPCERNVTNESDPLKSDDVSVVTSLSDGQASVCLSDTLDAAWIGKNNNLPDSVGSDTSSAGPSVKLDLEYHDEDLSTSKVAQSTSVLSNKSADNMEDTTSWLSMSFLSFYRSLNKNFLGSAQKLDTLSDYDPVYISSFRESEFQGGPRLLLPVGVSDTVIPVYDDEPTSIIAYALLSPDYYSQLSDEPERQKDIADSLFSTQSLDSGISQSFHSVDEMMLESYRSLGSVDDSVLSLMSSRGSLTLDPLSYTKASNAKVTFVDDGPLGKVKYSVTCYYAKRFEALRRMCCSYEVDFIRSLSRCKKWGAQGGKSNVFFAKTLDDRFIIKQVTKTELESFIKFAPGYFKYLSESIGSGSPTCLAKILGIYQVTSKHLKGGKETKMDVLVMENLLFGRNITRLYDLKGSSRSRYNPDSEGSNKVLLDQNLIEAMPTSPIFVGNKAKRLLERAVWNDTAFLASVDVMDYSLLVGVDEEKHELVLGIIDFMRQYTWDKHLETWVKASGILGGPKNASPTIISPKQYKRRFRKAMTTYFLMVPDQWSPPTIIPSKSQTDLMLSEDNSQNMTSAE